jgi:hypothetical protein
VIRDLLIEQCLRSGATSGRNPAPKAARQLGSKSLDSKSTVGMSRGGRTEW